MKKSPTGVLVQQATNPNLEIIARTLSEVPGGFDVLYEVAGERYHDYDNWRTITTLLGLMGLRLKVRRCRNQQCSRYLEPYRPEAEGRYALPQHEFGLDVIALIGTLRYSEHLSVPELHQRLTGEYGLSISERTVTNLLPWTIRRKPPAVKSENVLPVFSGPCPAIDGTPAS